MLDAFNFLELRLRDVYLKRCALVKIFISFGYIAENHSKCTIMRMTFVIFLLFCFCHKIKASEDACFIKQDSIFAYQKEVDWSEDIKQLWNWLPTQKNKQVVTFCRWDSKIIDCESDVAIKPIIGPFPCSQSETFFTFTGNLDKDKLAKGNGRVTFNKKSEKVNKAQ